MDLFQLLSFGDHGWGAALLKAAGMTVLLTLSALVVGAVAGSAVAAAKLSRRRLCRYIGDIYSILFRGIPELLVIYLFYFGGATVVGAVPPRFGGMTWGMRVRRVLIPQVWRYALPGLGNVWQLTLKDSALISVIGLVELMRASQVAAGSTRQYFTFYIVGGACYLILTGLSGRLFNIAETRVQRTQRRNPNA